MVHPIVIPLSVIASWPTPNYIDPPTLGWALPVIAVVFAAIAVAVFCARMWARIVKLKNVGADDWVMLFGLVLSICSSIALVFVMRDGQFNRHVWDIEADRFPSLRKIQFSAEVVYLVNSAAVKLSILLFLFRFTNTPVTQTFKYLTWACIVFVVAHVIAFMISLFLSCTPLNAFWDLTNPLWVLENEDSYHCGNEAAAAIATNVISVVQDFLAVILPIALFWKLQVSRRQKAGIMSLFALGLLICGTGILRIHYIWEAYYGTYDSTWNGGLLLIWSNIELNLAVICASVPTLKVFFAKRREPHQSSDGSNSNSNSKSFHIQSTSGTSNFSAWGKDAEDAFKDEPSGTSLSVIDPVELAAYDDDKYGRLSIWEKDQQTTVGMAEMLR